MKLAKVSDIEFFFAGERTTWGGYVNILREFVESGERVAEIEDFTSSVESARRALKHHIKRHNMPVAVRTKAKRRVFLIRV